MKGLKARTEDLDVKAFTVFKVNSRIIHHHPVYSVFQQVCWLHYLHLPSANLQVFIASVAALVSKHVNSLSSFLHSASDTTPQNHRQDSHGKWKESDNTNKMNVSMQHNIKCKENNLGNDSSE